MYKRFQKDGSNFLSLNNIQNSSFLFHSFKKIKDTTIAIVNNETLEAKFLRSWSVRNTRSNFLSLYDIKIQLKFSFPFISIKIKDTTIAIVNNNKTFKEIFEKLEYKKYKILGIIPKILNAKNFDTSNSVCVCVRGHCQWDCLRCICHQWIFSVLTYTEFTVHVNIIHTSSVCSGRCQLSNSRWRNSDIGFNIYTVSHLASIYLFI